MAGSRPDFGMTFVGWQARSDGASRQQTAGWLNGASSKLRNFATHARRGGCTNTSAIRRVGAGDRAGFTAGTAVASTKSDVTRAAVAGPTRSVCSIAGVAIG